ncbi:alcohol dehydrogenase-like regulatory protein ErcA [Desulfovibrio inopinatus]|uniref:alcohol dehydrogenase-like regulatory protein ErcA n=1 Tax=Desulfovibrio inopinatus TaxID=102109 RepID=UPI000481D60F|nr:alcohol dehydrogenase-like regulatory protein ErcA [Desulfovibrio inopinatus]
MNQPLVLELRRFMAPEFIFGAGALDLAGRHAARLGAQRVFVVTDPGVISSGWAGRVVTSLEDEGLESVIFDNVSPNPRDEQVMEAVAEYKEAECDAIVAVGGGSPMDLGKGVGVVIAGGKHILTYEGVDKITSSGPPLICIPTTAGTSADVSQFTIITDTSRNLKVAIVSKTLIPNVALIDPVPTTSLPQHLTAHTGLDALTHAIEAYVSTAHSPTTDLFAIESIKYIKANLISAMTHPMDLDLRGGMVLGSLYAGLAFSNAILGAVHAMAHSLGGLLDLPHGQCNAILLDHVIRNNFEACPSRYIDIARALGTEIPSDLSLNEQKTRVVDLVREFKYAAGVKDHLGNLGVTENELPALAKSALRDPCMATNPRPLTEDDIVTIFRQAL